MWSRQVWDAEWLEDDLDALIEWQTNQALTCSGCGHFLDETMDPEIHPSAFVVDKVTCNGCAARERVARGDTKGNKRPNPGTKYRVRNRSKD